MLRLMAGLFNLNRLVFSFSASPAALVPSSLNALTALPRMVDSVSSDLRATGRALRSTICESMSRSRTSWAS